MTNAAIASFAKYLPEEVLDNAFFLEKAYRDPATGELTFKTNEQFILENMGPETRRRSRPDEYTSDMASGVARQLVKGIDPQSIEGIIVATITPDRGFPSTAAMVQERIGAKNVRVAYDLAAACAGFPMALDQARANIQAGMGPFIVIAADTLTKIVDYQDRNCALFGDGAGGALVVPTNEEKGVVSSAGRSDPFNGKQYWIYKGAPTLNNAPPEPRGDGFNKGLLYMPQGPKVLKDAVDAMNAGIRAVADKAGWKLEEVDLVIAHQANIRILDALARRLPCRHVYNNIRQYGNMSAATCAVAAAEAQERGMLIDGTRLIISSYGSGTISSTVAVKF